MSTDTAPSSPSQPRPGNWRLLVVLAGLLIAVALFRPQAPQGERLIPAAGDGSQGFVTLLLKPLEDEPTVEAATAEVPWRADMTVYEATLQAGGSQPGVWQSRWQGNGEMAFLLELSEIANQGGEGFSWLFEVNGKRIDQGAGVRKLEAGDRVLWKFARYE